MLIVGIGLRGQSPDYIVDISNKSWKGKSIGNNSTRSIKTSKPILDVEIDTIHDVLYLILDNLRRGKPLKEGVVLAYDLNANSTIWTKEFKFSDETFRLLDTIPSLSEESDFTRVFNWKDGKFIRESEGSIVFLANDGKTGVANLKTEAYKWIVGVDMLSGRLVWDYKTLGELDGNNMYLMSDTSLTFITRGVTHLNIKDGMGFYKDVKTALPFSGSIISGVIIGGFIGGAIGGAFFGAFAAGSGRAEILVGNQHKNWIIDSTGIYIASQKELIKLDFRGNTIWENPMPQKTKTVGFSKLFFRDDHLFMVNDGKEFNPNSGTVYGPMFVAKMDSKTGDIKAYLDIKTEKREYMNDYLIKENSLLFALNERMLEVDDSTFTVLNERIFDTGSTNLGLRNIVNPPYYFEYESGFYNPLDDKPNTLYIENSTGMKIEFSEDYELKSVVKKNDFYKVKLEVGDCELITNETDSYLINSKGKRLNELVYTLSARIIKGYFIDFEDRELIITPVSDVGNE